MHRTNVAQNPWRSTPLRRIQPRGAARPRLFDGSEDGATSRMRPFKLNQQFGSDQWTTRRAVDIRQMRAATAQIDDPISRPQPVILRDVILR